MGEPARRCSTCSVDWPNANRYGTCPACQEGTWTVSDGDPMTQSEANHAEFDAFYQAREERRMAERSAAHASHPTSAAGARRDSRTGGDGRSRGSASGADGPSENHD